MEVRHVASQLQPQGRKQSVEKVEKPKVLEKASLGFSQCPKED